MNSGEHLIICGASTRAAAFSALRAGLRPWCIDLFADEDLRAKCPVMAIPKGEYPKGLADLVKRKAPAGPWMYTGGLENHRRQVRRISESHSLWGVGSKLLARVRHPCSLAALELPSPDVRFWNTEEVPTDGSWLVKPSASCGGRGVYPWRGRFEKAERRKTQVYFQELVTGKSCAASYLGSDQFVYSLGVSRQLVGESWLHARPYSYCGSIGPISFPQLATRLFQDLGRNLYGSFGLRGLFGVDLILDDEFPWVIEVNPRYTASVEVLEYAFDCAYLAWYPEIFLPEGEARSAFPTQHSTCPPDAWQGPSQPKPIGKAILFAKAPCVFPNDGPWADVLRNPPDVHDLPEFADIPRAGTRIDTGQPILTFFAGADSETACLEELKRLAAELDRWLYKG